MKTTGIYKITSPTGKIYIGQSKDIDKRFKRYYRLDCKQQVRLHRSFLKHSVESHIFEIIEECSFNQLNIRERYWQDHYDVLSNKGLNCTLQNSKEKRKEFSLSTKEKMSGKNNFMFRRTGDNHHFFGKKHTKEAIKKVSQANLGSKNPMFGRKGVDNHTSKKIIDYKTDVIYNSIKEAAESVGIKYSTLASYLSGKRDNKTTLLYY